MQDMKKCHYPTANIMSHVHSDKISYPSQTEHSMKWVLHGISQERKVKTKAEATSLFDCSEKGSNADDFSPNIWVGL